PRSGERDQGGRRCTRRPSPAGEGQERRMNTRKTLPIRPHERTSMTDTTTGLASEPRRGARRRLRFLTLAVVLSLLAAACGGGDASSDDETTTSAAGADDRPTELVVTHPQEPPNWNYWQTGATALTAPTHINVIQPLVERQADGSVEPLLAESWDVSDDSIEYTFHLREAKFHDGSDLD